MLKVKKKYSSGLSVFLKAGLWPLAIKVYFDKYVSMNSFINVETEPNAKLVILAGRTDAHLSAQCAMPCPRRTRGLLGIVVV